MAKLNKKFEYFTDYYDAYIISTQPNKYGINCNHYRNKRIAGPNLREHYYEVHSTRNESE